MEHWSQRFYIKADYNGRRSGAIKKPPLSVFVRMCGGLSLEQIYFFVCGAVLLVTLLTLWIAVIMPSTNQWNKRFFVTLFSIFVLCIITLFVDFLVYDDPSMALAEKIAAYFEYLLLSIPMPMFTAYLLHTCGEDWRKSSFFRIVIALWIIYFILLKIAQFTTFFYYVTLDNQYIRSSWHSLLVAPMFTVMILNLVGVIHRRDKLSSKYFVAFLIHLIPLQVALLINTMVIKTLVFVVLGLCISTLAMFTIILYDQIERYIAQQREIAPQRASIMVLQMQPHFIYNAMMSIYYLCAQDPKKAQQITLDFTAHLRKNFTAMPAKIPFPFPTNWNIPALILP